METGKMRDTESSLALQKGKTQQVKYYGLTGIQKMGGGGSLRSLLVCRLHQHRSEFCLYKSCEQMLTEELP